MLGYGELIIILGIALLLFGGKRLPELAQSLGKGIHEFKKALNGDVEDKKEPVKQEKDNLNKNDQ